MIKSKKTLWLNIYVVFIIIIGAFFLGFYFPTKKFLIDFLCYLLLSSLAEAFTVDLPWTKAGISIGFAINLAAILSLGISEGAWISALSPIITNLIYPKSKIPVYKTLFNASQFGLSAGLAGILYSISGGEFRSSNFIGNIFPIIIAIFTYFIINITLLGIVLSIDLKHKLTDTWKYLSKEFFVNYISLGSLGVLISLIQIQFGWLPVALFLIPLLLARYSFKLYAQLKTTYRSVIQALAKAVDTKDPYTKGHSERVLKYAKRIGEKLNLSQEKLDELIFSAILHDIGKIGVPDKILNKKERLTREEYDIIKKHPEEGEKILKNISSLKNIAKNIRHHHERVDGKGYPDGLKNGEIPLFAKIIAVVDSYDAMTTDRPYRLALSKKEAILELKRHSGTQFDEKIVEIFLQILEKEDK